MGDTDRLLRDTPITDVQAIRLSGTLSRTTGMSVESAVSGDSPALRRRSEADHSRWMRRHAARIWDGVGSAARPKWWRSTAVVALSMVVPSSSFTVAGHRRDSHNRVIASELYPSGIRI